MAFTLRIENRSQDKELEIMKLLKNCGLSFGSRNEFYVLEEGVANDNTAILFNPARIGRGIFYDVRERSEGSVELCMNLPTTVQEIDDFINIVKEMEHQMEQIALYHVEDECYYTMDELEDMRDDLVQFSIESLNRFCQNNNNQGCILTLTMWPLYLTKEQVEEFAYCTDLDAFEELLHNKQAMDIYYAKPRLHRNSNNGRIGAFYTLTEDCLSIFPTEAKTFINLDDIQIDDEFIRFYIYSEDRVVDGIFSYRRFMELMMMVEPEYFDREHIIIPPLSKEQIEELVEML